RAVLPSMRREGDGTIVNVSSVAGRVSFPGGGVYSGSKFAIEAMSDALRNEVGTHGIDVVVVEPGPVRTNFADRAEREAGGRSGETRGDGSDAGRTGAYEDVYALFEDAELVGGDGPGSVEPELVADAIVNAASATQPPARVQPGTAARVGVLARFLPDAVLDAGYDFVRKLVS
ncbi:SDR family NAD(P)-dependent oxidoreductase, partial [Halorubrum sp. SD626R]|uniref:SDR family NAD(P)-dependent oxidoreductase n=2 Tax=Halorubrum TaxID=56688 RepID=UPI0010F74E34